MLLGLTTATLFLANVLDFFVGSNTQTLNLVFGLFWLACTVGLAWHMFRTPDRNFVPIYRIKEYLPEDVYNEIKKKGPFQ